MPRFSREAVAALKTALRARAGEGYRFGDGEVVDLATRTGLSEAQVRHWVSDKHNYYTTGQEMERFLAGDGKVRSNRCQNTTVRNLDQVNRSIQRWKNATVDVLNCTGRKREGSYSGDHSLGC